MAGAVPMVPLPRRPLDAHDPSGPYGPYDPGGPGDPEARIRHWYENELGWPTVPGEPVRLVTGLRFDVLDVPTGAGAVALRHLGPGSPVALQGDRMRLLVAAGSAEELPGLLDWLEWGTLALDLVALGAGERMDAPLPPERALRDGADTALRVPGPVGGAAVWLRPPEPWCGADASFPTLSAMGGVGGAPDLVRLVDTVATQCHRIRLRRVHAGPSVSQPLAFS
ncbi:SCO3374 family protein [Streptomyces sp. HUAS TT20]|uniref:SCO3374 family protein n=1 Tax=Streptomyces sp. HUAS TT20 TaxID=3447509 RepID=UPI0021DA6332|nr:SCO3374 family protein [Streptomyces sp. HUAS 15-9]UXY29036.1 SCO3374 family protein [Streptomyces sp. HUAS 15-9]